MTTESSRSQALPVVGLVGLCALPGWIFVLGLLSGLVRQVPGFDSHLIPTVEPFLAAGLSVLTGPVGCFIAFLAHRRMLARQRTMMWVLAFSGLLPPVIFLLMLASASFG